MMREIAPALLIRLRTALDRVLTQPTAQDLWRLRGDLLLLGERETERPRQLLESFFSYLCDLESKASSRRASRWSAVLETSSVTSVGLQELVHEQADAVQRLLGSAVTAVLEMSAAVLNTRAWEIEASSIHASAAWYLYDEYWEIAGALRANLPPAERRAELDRLFAPLLDAQVSAAVKSALLIYLYQSALVARMLPLLPPAVSAEERPERSRS